MNCTLLNVPRNAYLKLDLKVPILASNASMRANLEVKHEPLGMSHNIGAVTHNQPHAIPQCRNQLILFEENKSTDFCSKKCIHILTACEHRQVNSETLEAGQGDASISWNQGSHSFSAPCKLSLLWIWIVKPKVGHSTHMTAVNNVFIGTKSPHHLSVLQAPQPWGTQGTFEVHVSHLH